MREESENEGERGVGGWDVDGEAVGEGSYFSDVAVVGESVSFLIVFWFWIGGGEEGGKRKVMMPHVRRRSVVSTAQKRDVKTMKERMRCVCMMYLLLSAKSQSRLSPFSTQPMLRNEKNNQSGSSTYLNPPNLATNLTRTP